MIIIGVDFHPEFQQIAWWIRRPESFRKKDWGIVRRRRSSIALLRQAGKRYVWEWRPAGTPAGSNDCWPSCSWSCGSGTRQ